MSFGFVSLTSSTCRRQARFSDRNGVALPSCTRIIAPIHSGAATLAASSWMQECCRRPAYAFAQETGPVQVVQCEHAVVTVGLHQTAPATSFVDSAAATNGTRRR